MVRLLTKEAIELAGGVAACRYTEGESTEITATQEFAEITYLWLPPSDLTLML